ncbi:12S rRNA N4-methylcytidine methyltransferase-like isoform X2 [Haliotis rufescens]|uniref:12S rRNA N4-methylcytidine methyltransferase-like isoform X2 n=1 Tax=Haliotis rufescens TaxID=6454 RepID=UPI00201F2CB1|nr:12S rRNA N4-methylcytidine methyltransferase-like isoform X2 [Haliotis rufescens]
MSQVKQLSRHKLSFCQLRLLQQVYSSKCQPVRASHNAADTEGRQLDQQGRQLGQKLNEDRHRRVPHIPVMLKEVMDVLKPTDGQVIVDMTFGGGGHTREIISRAQNARVFALDRDPVAFEMATQLSQECKIQDQPTAADVVNHIDEQDLYVIIKKYGEEKLARKIASAIVDTRYAFGNITRTRQLADIVASVFQGDLRRDKMMRHSHVATKTFQALRIFVNDELNELNNGLELAHRFLKPGGVCVALSFHSLEDRIVKRHFHGIDMDLPLNMNYRDHLRNPSVLHERKDVVDLLKKRWLPSSKKVCVPTYTDCLDNPRARSAKLRAAAKIQCN